MQTYKDMQTIDMHANNARKLHFLASLDSLQLYIDLASVHAENDMPQLRGVLIQSRIVADDTTLVGTFAVNADSNTTTRLSDCSPSNVSY